PLDTCGSRISFHRNANICAQRGWPRKGAVAHFPLLRALGSGLVPTSWFRFALASVLRNGKGLAPKQMAWATTHDLGAESGRSDARQRDWVRILWNRTEQCSGGQLRAGSPLGAGRTARRRDQRAP